MSERPADDRWIAGRSRDAIESAEEEDRGSNDAEDGKDSNESEDSDHETHAQWRFVTICRISAAVCSPLSGVPGTRYLPIASPPMATGSKPISRMSLEVTSIACWSSPAIGTPTSSPCRCAFADSLA